MPSFCKQCNIGLNDKSHRARRLCPVCAGEKKRCGRCKRFFDIAIEGDFCPRCAKKRAAVPKKTAEPIRVTTVEQREQKRLSELRSAWVKLGLDKIFKNKGV